MSVSSIREQPASNIQFDNLTVSAVGTNPLSGIGTYESIIYNSWSPVDTADGVVSGVSAHNEPNGIDTSSEQQATNGTSSFTVAKRYTSFWLTNF